MIYVFWRRGTREYKIGYTRDVTTLHKRRAALQTANAGALDLLALWEGTREEEQNMHRLLQRFRSTEGGGQEWFELEMGKVLEFLFEQMISEKLSAPPDESPAQEGEYGPVRVIRGRLRGTEGLYEEDVEVILWEMDPEYRSMVGDHYSLNAKNNPVTLLARLISYQGEEYLLPHHALTPIE